MLRGNSAPIDEQDRSHEASQTTNDLTHYDPKRPFEVTANQTHSRSMRTAPTATRLERFKPAS